MCRAGDCRYVSSQETEDVLESKPDFFKAIQMASHVNLKEFFRNEWMLRCIIDVSMFFLEHLW